MSEVSIRIKIADREYPLRVSAADEERIREAGRLINEKIKTFRDQFGLDDKQDLLAMVAFDLLVEKTSLQTGSKNTEAKVLLRIEELDHLVTAALNE